MIVRTIRVICCMFSIAVAVHVAAQPDLQQLVRQSQFIFFGTVARTGASNVDAVPAAPSNAVVRVDRILLAPETLGDFTGRDITVALTRADAVKAGQKTVFFTRGWMYGKTLAVREVAHIDGNDPGALGASIAEARRRNEEQDLQALLASAELVVVGPIMRTETLHREDFRLPITEHDPELVRAVIRVETALKGQPPADRAVPVLFANSRDVMWERSPKPKEGQSAIWILRRDEKRGLKLEALTLFEARDVQPLSRLDLIRRLLGANPR